MGLLFGVIRGLPHAPTLRALAHCGLHFPPSVVWLWGSPFVPLHTRVFPWLSRRIVLLVS